MKRLSLSALRLSSGLAILAVAWTARFEAAHAEPYTLVPEDRIKLRIVEWRSSEEQYASWQALEGTYAVDHAGNLSIPIAGQITAIGKTTEQVSDAVATALTEKAALPGKPFIAVEIAEHAPIFITGAVETPGRYSFQTNMTVMKAVSVAGGFLRRGETYTLERNRIEAAGAYRTAALVQRDLLVRRARLSAEIAGETSFEIPAELSGTPDIDKLKEEETNLMRLRRIELKSRIDAADDLSRLYSREIKTLEAKITSQKRQIDLAQREFDSVNNLASRGLTDNARHLSVDRGLAEAQGRLLDLEIALTKARQSLSESEQEKLNIVNKQNAENQQEVNTIDLAIRKSAIDIQVARLLGEQADYSAQVAGSTQEEAVALGDIGKTFRIMRRNGDGSYSHIDADETTPLLPHDLIEVGVGVASQTSSLPQHAQPSPAMLANMAQEGPPVSEPLEPTKRRP
ncbi:polysaccharide biosynthesis/export family protein [Sinorhizobium garamanticum]|uniref:Polysaccharide biosynthesis/export family protein n=1 Tax=Sinorhizobium garamanticum TaxID=680247 RepID=A0ABY8DFS3_9HYPH|nr:polysaccharide biosynthesis/export family protein [Sinorhizobium garamanticum]WEX89746.1 polysaccharide biosynthesis/export family protein [Sinorhizobium garamanticum]